MPWNEPGGNGKNNDNDPWSGKDKQNPPDLDKLISDFLKKIRSAFTLKSKKTGSSWNPSFSNDHHYGMLAALAALFLIWFLSGFFIVNPAEEAVVLRLGKYLEVLPSGVHWMARFVDTKYVVDVQKIYSFSLQGDFLTKSSDLSDMPNQYIQVNAKKDNVNDQSKNLVNVELNVQYRIANPQAYLFNVVNPDETIQQVASGALSDVIGQMKLDDVLTTGREYLSSGVLEKTRKILNSYHSGLEVIAVTLRKAQAPDQVREAFTDVNRADQDKATFIQQAQAYASKVVPLAQGIAARTLANATGYQQQVVLAAQGNIAKYQALLKVYTVSPDITRERLYLETIQKILSHTTKVVIDFNTNNMLYLPLDKLFQQAEQTLGSGTSDNGQSVNLQQLISNAQTNQNLSNGSEVKNVTN